MKHPKAPGIDALEAAVLPFTTLKFGQARLDPAKFVRGLIDPGQAPPEDPDFTADFEKPYPANSEDWDDPGLAARSRA